MEDNKTVHKQSQRRLFFKIGFILILVLLLMIPNTLIQGVISERQSLEAATQHEIAASWGPRQKIVGPVLSIPFISEVINNGEKTTFENVLRILPAEVKIDADLESEERKKSIYKAILYNADHRIKGSFNMPDKKEFGNNLVQIEWEKAVIDIGFTSSASLTDIVFLTFNDERYKMMAGSSDTDLFSSAIHSNINLNKELESFDFSTQININGSEAIRYVPIANNTTINLRSDWDSPGFIGLPLPQNREISQAGFNAEWKTTEYNRSFKGIWRNSEVNLRHNTQSFGVDLVQTVGHYQKNMRSAKYALLIISLSFLVFFFFEILKGSRIHAVQYIFVGVALSIFYSLLLSLSEHLGFDGAYLIASTAVVGLITWYSKYILRRSSSVMILSFILGGLYTYIYILLQMEEFALLVGSIGLFMALAITMYLSRNMDWYRLGHKVIPNDGDQELSIT